MKSNPKRALKLGLLSHWHIQYYCTKFSRISTRSSDPQVESLSGILKDSHKILSPHCPFSFYFPKIRPGNPEKPGLKILEGREGQAFWLNSVTTAVL